MRQEVFGVRLVVSSQAQSIASQSFWNRYLLALALLLALTLTAPAAAQTYTTIDYPGSLGSFATDINDSGQIKLNVHR